VYCNFIKKGQQYQIAVLALYYILIFNVNCFFRQLYNHTIFRTEILQINYKSLSHADKD